VTRRGLPGSCLQIAESLRARRKTGPAHLDVHRLSRAPSCAGYHAVTAVRAAAVAVLERRPAPCWCFHNVCLTAPRLIVSGAEDGAALEQARLPLSLLTTPYDCSLRRRRVGSRHQGRQPPFASTRTATAWCPVRAATCHWIFVKSRRQRAAVRVGGGAAGAHPALGDDLSRAPACRRAKPHTYEDFSWAGN